MIMAESACGLESSICPHPGLENASITTTAAAPTVLTSASHEIPTLMATDVCPVKPEPA